MSDVGYVCLASSGEKLGTLSTDGLDFVPDEGEFCADDPPTYFGGGATMFATIKDMDEDLLRILFGWTVLVVENPDTHTKALHRAYTWDYKNKLKDGVFEFPARHPTLIIPAGIPNEDDIISRWLEMDEVPSEDYAYVTRDEPNVIHVASILDASWGIGRYFMEHDL